MEEMLDIYDEGWEHIGTAPRSEVHEKGLLHQVVHCWIIAQSEPVLYFQQRAHTKEDFPDCYDLACGGHIDAGEKPGTAAIREIREEIGLDIQTEQLVSLGKYRAPDFKIDGYFDRAISNVFVLRWDHPPFVPGQEVEQMVCVPAAEFYRMEVENAERIQVKAQTGTIFFSHRDEWCCHDGEFAAMVLPYLREAFPEFVCKEIDKIDVFSIINEVSKVNSRANCAERPLCEESPGCAGQDNG